MLIRGAFAATAERRNAMLALGLVEQPAQPFVERAGNGAVSEYLLPVECDHEPVFVRLDRRSVERAERCTTFWHVSPRKDLAFPKLSRAVTNVNPSILGGSFNKLARGSRLWAAGAGVPLPLVPAIISQVSLISQHIAANAR